MNDAEPVVSVIIPLHNHADTIVATVASVLGQRNVPDDVHIEIVVVDDASTDGGADLLDHDIVTIIHQPARRGAAAARNLGVAHSKGEFLVFLDSDDLLPPHRIAHQLAAFEQHHGIDVVGGRAEEFADDSYVPTRALRPTMLTAMVGALMIRRSAFERVGPFDEQITQREVVDWGARLRRSGITVAPIDEVVLQRRLHPNNHGLDGAHAEAILRAVRQHITARRHSDGAAEPG